jgi:hypothetical protein
MHHADAILIITQDASASRIITQIPPELLYGIRALATSPLLFSGCGSTLRGRVDRGFFKARHQTAIASKAINELSAQLAGMKEIVCSFEIVLKGPRFSLKGCGGREFFLENAAEKLRERFRERPLCGRNCGEQRPNHHQPEKNTAHPPPPNST